MTSFRNKASIAVSESFTDAVYEGYQKAGAELPLPDDIQAWLSQRIAEERTHIEGMFDRLKQEWEGLDWIKEAYARADSYSRTLDAMYSEAQLRGMKNQMITWILGDTEEHCETCATLAGKKHRISYLIANNYIPRKPDAGMDCHGYRCDCKIVDKNGKEVTIGETKAMKGGEGSGNFGHAGRPGEVGGSASDSVLSGTNIAFGATHGGGSAAAQAMGDKIIVSREQYTSLSDSGKSNLVAHELAHNLVEDKLLKNMDEWDRANEALLIQTRERNGNIYFLYMLGESRIGEAMVSTIAARVTDAERPSGWTPEQWDKAMNWADHALTYSGYTKDEFYTIVVDTKQRLDATMNS